MRGDFQAEVGLFERHGCRTAGAGFLIRNFRTLFDTGFNPVGGHDARTGQNLALVGGFHGIQFQADGGTRTSTKHGADGVIGTGQAQVHPGCQRDGATSRSAGDIEAGGGIGQRATNTGAATGACDIELHTQALAPVVGGFDDTCFNQHLLDRNVRLGHQIADLVDHGLGVVDDQGIGFRVDHEAATGRQQAVAAAVARCIGAGSGGAAIQNLLEVLGRAVTQDKGFRADGLQGIELLLAFQNLLVAVEQLFTRGNIDDVAIAALIQALGLQNQVQRLIPRHVFQAQRDIAGDRVTGDDVQPGEFGNHLQHGAYFDVLEVERQLVALVLRLAVQLVLAGTFHHGLAYFHHQLAFGLVGGEFPVTLRLNQYTAVAALIAGNHLVHRCGKVADIHALFQRTRQIGTHHVQHQVFAFTTDINRRALGWQVDFHPALAATATTEVQTQRGGGHGCLGTGLGGSGSGAGRLFLRSGGLLRRRHAVIDAYQQFVAGDAGAVGHVVCQVQHQAGAAVGLNRDRRFDDGIAQINRVLRQLDLRIGKVEGDTRRVGNGEAVGLAGRPVKGDLQQLGIAIGLGDVDRGDGCSMGNGKCNGQTQPRQQFD